MNVAYFLRPKSEVTYIYEDTSVEEGIIKMRNNGYTAIPVLTSDNQYLGTLSEGDFLWYFVDTFNPEGISIINTEEAKNKKVRDIMNTNKNRPVLIDTKIEELLQRAMVQNFVPVIDDRGMFIGIVTRKSILAYLIEK